MVPSFFDQRTIFSGFFLLLKKVVNKSFIFTKMSTVWNKVGKKKHYLYDTIIPK